MHPLRNSLLALIAVSMSLGLACAPPEDGDADALDSSSVALNPVLRLVREKKVSQLLSISGVTDYEASGVQAHGGYLYIVFDDMTKIGKVTPDLLSGSYTSGGSSNTNSQYEGITFDNNNTEHFYVIEERSPGVVVRLDSAGNASSAVDESTDVNFSDSNKGFEGIAWLRRNNNDYQLGLCEGDDCTYLVDGSRPGAIKVLAQSGTSWITETTLRLPSTANFLDFSDIGLWPQQDGSYLVAVTSQMSKKLWVGRLSGTSWAFLDSGTVYDFPSADYCNVEGVTFLSPTRVAMVSDMNDIDDPNHATCNNKDEMVHIFDLP